MSNVDKNKKISEALKGNKNAETYAKNDAIKLFNDSIELALMKGEKGEYKYDFIGEIARDLGTYHYIYAHLISRFPELSSKFTELKQTLEANCYWNTKKGNIREAIGIVNLKSNHNWTDRQQINQNVSNTGKPQIVVADKTTIEEVEKLINEND